MIVVGAFTLFNSELRSSQYDEVYYLLPNCFGHFKGIENPDLALDLPIGLGVLVHFNLGIDDNISIDEKLA